MNQIYNIDEFFELQQKFEFIPFTQSRGWYNYLNKNLNKFAFYVDNKFDPKFALWGLEHKIPIIGKTILRIEGECYHSDLKEKDIKSFYFDLTNQKYIAIEISNNSPYNIEYEIGLRRAGFKKPLALFACPLTIELDLTRDLKFNRNWRRNVKVALENNLYFKELTSFSEDIFQVIVEIFSEMTKLKGLSYRLEKNSLKKLLESPDIRTFLVYNIKGNPIASRIIHLNKKYVSDVFAANSIEARKFGATYFIMEQIFHLLKAEGYHFFDFGRIPPSNNATDNIYIYKNASRGKKIQYNGEWVYYKNSVFEGSMFIYKKFIIKKQRY